MKRRDAIKTTALGLGAVTLGTSCQPTPSEETSSTTNTEADMPKERNIGIQLFTIPKLVDKDLKGTLQVLSDIGYKEIEFFGPYPSSVDGAKEAWEPLKGLLGLERHAFWGNTVVEVAAMLKEMGLTAPSMHADMATMREGLGKMLDNFALLETKYIALPALIEGRSNLDDYKRLAAEFNYIGEQMSKYRIKFMYHNHGYEHIEMDGQIPMNYLLENTDPKYVQFELDIFWMAAAGADPVEYLKAYPNRFKALHIKDAAEKFRFSGDGGSPEGCRAVDLLFVVDRSESMAEEQTNLLASVPK